MECTRARNFPLFKAKWDTERVQCTGASTWGLFHSGRHYGAIKATVLHWCGDARAAAKPSGEGGRCEHIEE